jgi:hypothetical protein
MWNTHRRPLRSCKSEWIFFFLKREKRRIKFHLLSSDHNILLLFFKRSERWVSRVSLVWHTHSGPHIVLLRFYPTVKFLISTHFSFDLNL